MRGRLILLIALLVGLPAAAYFFAPRGEHADRLAAARAAIDRRDFASARRELDAHLADNPHDRDARFLAARTARRDGDGAAAEQHLSLYLEVGGDRQTAELERSMRRSQEGDVSGTNGVLRFCDAHPDHPEAAFMLEAQARGLVAANQPRLAVACLDRWLARNPGPADRAQALAWRGEAFERAGLAPEAVADYRRAVEADPANAAARLRLANVLVRDEPAEALAQFEHLRRADPENPDVLLGIARAHRQAGNHAAAEQFLARAGPLRTDDLAYLTERGALALDRGRPADAEAPLRRAVALAPTRRDPNVQLLRCLQELGKDAEAEALRAKLKQIDAEIQKKIDAFTKGGS